MYNSSFIKVEGRKQRLRVPKHLIETPKKKKRKNSTKRKNNSKWRDLRGWALVDRNYCCEECEEVANCVHHILPVIEFPEKQLDKDNLMVLCNKCHRLKHKELPSKLF